MAKQRDLLSRLNDGPLLFDGGMGTQLMEQGLAAGSPGVRWNVDEPDKVKAIHRAYLDAGCDIVTTNTFQGSREALSMHLLDDRTVELNEAGARIARDAAGSEALVAADIGPFGGFLEPLGETTLEELTDIFIEQMTALKDGGADFVLIETMSDMNEAHTAIKAAKQVDADWPIVVSYTYQKSGDQFLTMMGTLAGEMVNAAFNAGADVVGANCGTAIGLEDYIRLADAMNDAAGGRPVVLQPNAGAPITEGDQIKYPATPKQMAKIVPRLLASGVTLIGGCCGTTPKHLAAMAEAMHADIEA